MSRKRNKSAQKALQVERKELDRKVLYFRCLNLFSLLVAAAIIAVFYLVPAASQRWNRAPESIRAFISGGVLSASAADLMMLLLFSVPKEPKAYLVYCKVEAVIHAVMAALWTYMLLWVFNFGQFATGF